jgi:amino acid transporter
MGFMIDILAYLIVLVAAVIQVFCEFGRQARPDIKPKILRGRFRFVMEGLWVFLLTSGCVVLLFPGSPGNLLMVSIAIIAFWLVLPFVINPILRHRVLPPWDEVKKELAPLGYTEKDYWRGGWWMKEGKEKRKPAQNK